MTPKQEKFCLAYIETGNASEAYRRSYQASNMKPETVHTEASRLIRHPDVFARIQQLQDSHVRRHNITIDSLTTELDETRKLAIGKGQSSAAISAIMGKAKLHGLLSERLQQATGEDDTEQNLKDNEVDDVELRNRCIWFLAEDDAGRAKKIARFLKTMAS